MFHLTFIGIIALIIFFFILGNKKTKKQVRYEYIESYDFHTGIHKKLAQKHPQLTEEQLNLVFTGLKHFFQICCEENRQMVVMPSQVVDDAWHEFILFTESYGQFCDHAFGRFLHHTPAEAMDSPSQAKEGIKRAWQSACTIEQINPKIPTSLPLLFAIDDLLKIDNGFIYRLDCFKDDSGNAYCASHIGSSAPGCDSGGCGGGCGGGC